MVRLLRAFVTLLTFLVTGTPVPSAGQGTLAPVMQIQFETNAGAPCASCVLYSWEAGTSTLLSTYSDSALTVANANPIVLNSAGRNPSGGIYLSATSYKFELRTSGGTVLWTQDNVGSVPTTNVSLDVTGTAGEALSAGNVVYLSDGSGSLTAGRWYKADADNTYSSSYAQFIGMVPTAIASGASGSIRVQGRATGLSALTAGNPYYVSATAGALAASPGTNGRRVGAADSSTALLLDAVPGPKFPELHIGTGAPSLTMTNSSANGKVWSPSGNLILSGETATGSVTMVPRQAGSTTVTFESAYTNHAVNVFVNDTSNVNQALGVTINQGANDDEAEAWKSSDAAHGMTTVAETDTYGTVQKESATVAGLRITGFSEDATAGITLRPIAGSADTAKTTAAGATFIINAQIANGTGVQALGADGNIAAFRNSGTTRQILDGDGDSHQDVGTAWTNFDSHDDVSVLNALAVEVARPDDPFKDAIKARFAADMQALLPRAELARIGLVTFSDDGHHFVNMSKLTMLNVGAIRQVNDRQRDMQVRMAALERQLEEQRQIINVLLAEMATQSPQRVAGP